MSEKRKVGKRIIGAGMLLMMVMLVIATVAFAEDAAGHGNSSYSCSFLLGKQFEVLVRDHNPDGSKRPDEEIEAARADAEQKAKAGQYRFRVQAVLQCGEELWTEEKTVTLPLTGDAAVDGAGVEQADGDRWTAKITFKGAKSAYLTAAEVMEGNTVGNWYQKAPNLDVSRPAEENGVRGDRSTASYLSISKDGGHIRIEKPMNKASQQENLYAYRLTGYAKEEGDPLPEGGKTIRLVVWPPAAEGSGSLSPEDERDIQVDDWGTGVGFAVKSEGAVDIRGLPAGTYKLEELSADGGFTFVVENPSVTMSAVPAVDGTGMALGRNNRVNINGLGEVTFNAPHDGKSHHYIVTKNGDANFREEITVPPNGFVRQNIQQGSYTIRENTAPSVEGFTVLTPRVGERLSWQITETANNKKNFGIATTFRQQFVPENDDYYWVGVGNIKINGKTSSAKVSGIKIGSEWRNIDNGIYNYSNFVSNKITFAVEPMNGTRFSVQMTDKSVTGYTTYIYLRKHDSTVSADGQPCTVKVEASDDRTASKRTTGELVVRKPADTSGSPVADQIDYYFTVTGPGGYEESLVLHAGEEKRFTGLVPGEYTVTETKVDNPGGKDFVVNIKDAPYTSHTGESLTAYLRQGGSILLEKPARSAEERPDDAAWGKRKYFFAVDRVDLDHLNSEGKPTVLGTVTEFTLTPGESLLLSATGAAPAAAEATRVIEVPPDSYTIRPIGDENSGFRMLYGSSNTLAVIGEFRSENSGARAADEDAPAENKELVKLISTNRLTEEAAGYRIIHEYYESEEDLGNKDLAEDSTRMESIRGEAADTVHTAAEVDRLEQAPNGKFYRYVEYGYGRLQEKSTQQPRMTFRDTGPAPEAQRSAPAGARVTDSGPAPQQAKAAPAGDDTTNWIEIGGGNYTYHPEDALKDGVQSTLRGEQVIILRYVRDPSLDPPTQGGYRVVHRYYLRDEGGDHYEGDTDRELREGLPIDKTYTAAEVGEKCTFTAEEGDEIGKEHQYRLDWIEYGTVNADGTYRRDTAMKHVTARADNSEMIVLCYVRELPPKPEEPKPDDPVPDNPDPNDPDKPDNPGEPEPEDPTPDEPAEEDPEPDPTPEPAPDDDDDDDDDPPPPPAPKPPVSPDTGDGSRTGLWMLLSAGFLTALGLLRRRRR